MGRGDGCQVVEDKDMLKPKKTNWNPSQFSLLPTLMMWCLAEKLWPFIRKLNTHLAQEWQKLKEDPGEGGAVAEPAEA